MLKGIAVMIGVEIIVVGIGNKILIVGKDVGRTHIGSRQLRFLRFSDFKEIARVVTEVAAQFVSQIGIGRTFAHNL